MSFDWSQYLNVAKELAGFATTPANQEAKLRAAISRAYYAAFVKARNYLRDKQGHSIPETADVHNYVWNQFKQNPDPGSKTLAKNLKQLRRYRNLADYNDTVAALSGITRIAVRLSEQVIYTLGSL